MGQGRIRDPTASEKKLEFGQGRAGDSSISWECTSHLG